MPIAAERLPGPRQSATSGTARLARAPAKAAAARLHQLQTLHGLQGADEHGRRRSLRLGHGVHEMVQSVIDVDVRVTGLAVEGRVARGRADRRVTGGITLPDVGLDLDDGAGGDPGVRTMDQHLAQEIPRDLQRRTLVEVLGQDQGAAGGPSSVR